MSLQQRLADLERIAQLQDAVIRNLLITQRYHDLSHELAGVLGLSNANWSTFACWASKTAGISIRMQEVPAEFSAALHAEAKLEEKLSKLYTKLGFLGRLLVPRQNPLDLARAIIAEVSSQIAEGNLKVYAELAPLFAKFAYTFSSPGSRTKERLDAFLNDLKPGPASKDGQEDLKEAFTAYFVAADTEDEIMKAQLILYGNVKIGLHEQTRLQQNIAGGIDAPFTDRVYEQFFAHKNWLLQPVVKWFTVGAVKVFAREFRDDWQRLATRFMMRLSTPDGHEIPLGVDLPAGEFPPELAVLTYEQLISLLLEYDPDLTTTKGSAAVDWVRLKDRMRFIGELFRIKQRRPHWFNPPFTSGQRLELEAGRVPVGPLG